MGREFELKYAATPQILDLLAQTYPGGQQITMQTTYYDTADRVLSRQRMTLRLRLENGQPICTLKTPLADGSRGEWECSASDIASALPRLAALGAAEWIRSIAADLHPVCAARFTRLAIPIPTADGMAELALDQGVLIGGGKECPLCEVEVELKSGSEAAAVALASELARQYDLRPEPRSKYRRALALAQGD